MINQDAWRRGWEGNDQFADAAGPLRIGAIDEHDRIRLPGGRLKCDLSNGWDYVVHGWRSVGANYGYLSAKLPENRLKTKCRTECIGIWSLMRHNPQPLCRTKRLQHVCRNSSACCRSECISTLQVFSCVNGPLLAHPLLLRLFSSTPVRVGAGSGESVSGGSPPSAMLPSSC